MLSGFLLIAVAVVVLAGAARRRRLRRRRLLLQRFTVHTGHMPVHGRRLAGGEIAQATSTMEVELLLEGATVAGGRCRTCVRRLIEVELVIDYGGSSGVGGGGGGGCGALLMRLMEEGTG